MMKEELETNSFIILISFNLTIMREEDINKLSKPYDESPDGIFDNRFESIIGADVPSSEKLVEEIFNDLDSNSFGIQWFANIPEQERILISDYLYQCAVSIETNLAEAKLHFLEWLDSRVKNDKRISEMFITETFPNAPIDELYRKLEELHVCGFFRAIGSSFDCLGALIIGVLALPVSLRRSDIKKAEFALSKVQPNADQGTLLQLEFRDFLEDVKNSCGPKDWLEWADQYRNMLVHRGRRTIYFNVTNREPHFFDSRGNLIPRFKSTMHLAKYPDGSDVEAFIKGININLSEDAEITLSGIFKSCRDFNEIICERLVEIWSKRRNQPLLLEQPIKQWDGNMKICDFDGYSSESEVSNRDTIFVNPALSHRIKSASVLDHQKHLWNNSKWS